MGGSPFQRLVQFVKRSIVRDVPEELALCEFDCRKGQCMLSEWATCDRRTHQAGGELFPDDHLAEKP
jgi:hypothetical protein